MSFTRRCICIAGYLFLAGLWCGGLGLTAAEAPTQAAQAGYSLNTFSNDFARSTIDVENTKGEGFSWYLAQFFGRGPSSRATISTSLNGEITLGSDALGTRIGTAAPVPTNKRWVGVAFGGGAYFEATLKFDPKKSMRPKLSSWPAFWSMAIEHLADLPSQQWPGEQAGYDHFIELDFFEYDVWLFRPPYCYGGAVHDWYGEYKKSCPGKGYCNANNTSGGNTRFANFVVEPAADNNFELYHTFGFLWVPATSSTIGVAQYYFDNKATTDRVTWSKYDGQPPPPGNAAWTFGIVDQQHLVLMLETGEGQPMTVKSVNVWQSSAQANLRQ